MKNIFFLVTCLFLRVYLLIWKNKSPSTNLFWISFCDSGDHMTHLFYLHTKVYIIHINNTMSDSEMTDLSQNFSQNSVSLNKFVSLWLKIEVIYKIKFVHPSVCNRLSQKYPRIFRNFSLKLGAKKCLNSHKAISKKKIVLRRRKNILKFDVCVFLFVVVFFFGG